MPEVDWNSNKRFDSLTYHVYVTQLRLRDKSRINLSVNITRQFTLVLRDLSL